MPAHCRGVPVKGGKPDKGLLKGRYIFVMAVCLLYVVLFLVDQERSVLALNASIKIFGYIFLSLSVVFVLMILMNLFFRSAQVTRLLGEKSGFRGVMLAAAAGIISMGPIYAWYPLLKEVRSKGAGNIAIAVFLGNRALKPFLLPVMISYFGWIYVALLTLFMFIASVVEGYGVDTLYKAKWGR